MKRFSSLSLIVMFVLASFLTACATNPNDPNQKTKKGAVVGAVAGATAGAVIGHQKDKKEEGAIVGAVVGAGVGAAIGRMMDKQQQELEQIEGVEVTRTADDELNVVMKNDILFDHNSYALRADSRQTLREMADVFVTYPETAIWVEGHTDSSGSDSYNQQLSERRARAVTNFLSDQGVSRTRVETYGHGETQPVASNDNASGRQLNRRVEIQVRATGQGG